MASLKKIAQVITKLMPQALSDAIVLDSSEKKFLRYMWLFIVIKVNQVKGNSNVRII